MSEALTSHRGSPPTLSTSHEVALTPTSHEVTHNLPSLHTSTIDTSTRGSQPGIHPRLHSDISTNLLSAPHFDQVLNTSDFSDFTTSSDLQSRSVTPSVSSTYYSNPHSHPSTDALLEENNVLLLQNISPTPTGPRLETSQILTLIDSAMANLTSAFDSFNTSPKDRTSRRTFFPPLFTLLYSCCRVSKSPSELLVVQQLNFLSHAHYLLEESYPPFSLLPLDVQFTYSTLNSMVQVVQDRLRFIHRTIPSSSSLSSFATSSLVPDSAELTHMNFPRNWKPGDIQAIYQDFLLGSILDWTSGTIPGQTLHSYLHHFISKAQFKKVPRDRWVEVLAQAFTTRPEHSWFTDMVILDGKERPFGSWPLSEPKPPDADTICGQLFLHFISNFDYWEPPTSLSSLDTWWTNRVDADKPSTLRDFVTYASTLFRLCHFDIDAHEGNTTHYLSVFATKHFLLCLKAGNRIWHDALMVVLLRDYRLNYDKNDVTAKPHDLTRLPITWQWHYFSTHVVEQLLRNMPSGLSERLLAARPAPTLHPDSYEQRVQHSFAATADLTVSTRSFPKPKTSIQPLATSSASSAPLQPPPTSTPTVSSSGKKTVVKQRIEKDGVFWVTRPWLPPPYRCTFKHNSPAMHIREDCLLDTSNIRHTSPDAWRRLLDIPSDSDPKSSVHHLIRENGNSVLLRYFREHKLQQQPSASAEPSTSSATAATLKRT